MLFFLLSLVTAWVNSRAWPRKRAALPSVSSTGRRQFCFHNLFPCYYSGEIHNFFSCHTTSGAVTGQGECTMVLPRPDSPSDRFSKRSPIKTSPQRLRATRGPCGSHPERRQVPSLEGKRSAGTGECTGEAKGRGAGHASIQMTEGAEGHCHLREPSRTSHHPAGTKGEPKTLSMMFLLCFQAFEHLLCNLLCKENSPKISPNCL